MKNDIPELRDVLARKNDWPRFVQHEGRTYDLSKKFDQNCVKMHVQRISLERRRINPPKLVMMNRHQRRASQVKQRTGG